MDIQKDYLCIEQYSRVLSKKLDIDLDFQEALPAYLDDVYRVVKCTANSYITSADIRFNEIKIIGKVNIRLTYYNENSALSFADFEEDFSKSITAENLSDNAFVTACICDKYVSFRVINQRRVDIHISSLAHIDVYDKISCPCISKCSLSKLKKERIPYVNVNASDITKIEFDEEYRLPSEASPIKRIISYNAFASLSDIKVIKDKALIKASVNVSVLYTCDGDTEETDRCEYSFNVSKIAEISGVNDDDIIIPDISIGSVFIKAKNLSGDKLDTLNIYGEVIVNSYSLREENSELITDAYILNRNTDCTYSDVRLLTDGNHIDEVKQISVDYTVPDDITQIKELSFDIVSFTYKNSKLMLNTKITAVALNNNGDLVSVISENEAELSVESADGVFASLGIQSFDYSFSADGKIRVRAQLTLNAYFYNERNIKVISDINAGEEELSYPSITVYFGKENEELWEIAKAFSSDAELIKSENGITSDSLDSNRIIIIPRV